MKQVIAAQVITAANATNVREVIEILTTEISVMAAEASACAVKLEKMVSTSPWFDIEVELKRFERLEDQAADLRNYVLSLHLYALEELNEVFALVA